MTTSSKPPPSGHIVLGQKLLHGPSRRELSALKRYWRKLLQYQGVPTSNIDATSEAGNIRILLALPSLLKLDPACVWFGRAIVFPHKGESWRLQGFSYGPDRNELLLETIPDDRTKAAHWKQQQQILDHLHLSFQPIEGYKKILLRDFDCMRVDQRLFTVPLPS